jgi:hypothetical protein
VNAISFAIALGVSGATQTLVRRAIGAREPELAVIALKNGLGVALAVSVALAVGLTAAPRLLMRIFTDDPDVLALGVSTLRLGALFQLLDAAHIVAMGPARRRRHRLARRMAERAGLVRVPAARLAVRSPARLRPGRRLRRRHDLRRAARRRLALALRVGEVARDEDLR